MPGTATDRSGTIASSAPAQAIEGEAGSSEDEDAHPSARATGPTYVEEQEQLRQAFLQVGCLPLRAPGIPSFVQHACTAGAGGRKGHPVAARTQEVEEEQGAEQDEDGFGGILRQKRRMLPDAPEGAAGDGGGGQTPALLDAYFGADEGLPEGERFLKAYISQQARAASRLCRSTDADE